MIIRSAKFVKSSAKLSQCPATDSPEFAFIGRSNVGKSSLINMLTGHRRLAKISSTPGKTQTINHFIINDDWYIVDLPGYGYARTASKLRKSWASLVDEYLKKRENIACIFVLIDSRIKPQESDLRFMEMLGLKALPFSRIFTKTDKLTPSQLKKSVENYNLIMRELWEELPVTFYSSAKNAGGREEIISFIEQTINIYKKGI